MESTVTADSLSMSMAALVAAAGPNERDDVALFAGERGRRSTRTEVGTGVVESAAAAAAAAAGPEQRLVLLERRGVPASGAAAAAVGAASTAIGDGREGCSWRGGGGGGGSGGIGGVAGLGGGQFRLFAAAARRDRGRGWLLIFRRGQKL